MCIDTYVRIFISTKRFRHHPDISRFVPGELLGPLGMIHAACDAGRPLSESQRRAVFAAHFLHEQHTIVGETLRRAAAAFDWPLAKFIAVRPRVRFAYLPARTVIPFRNFADKQERIRNGLQAFDLASQAGWKHVEDSLSSYGLLDSAAFSAPDQHFSQLRSDVLGETSATADRHKGLVSYPRHWRRVNGRRRSRTGNRARPI